MLWLLPARVINDSSIMELGILINGNTRSMTLDGIMTLCKHRLEVGGYKKIPLAVATLVDFPEVGGGSEDINLDLLQTALSETR